MSFSSVLKAELKNSFAALKTIVMNDTRQQVTDPLPGRSEFNEAEFDKNFKPKGAIAFFILLIILGAFIWYGIYFLMLERA
jgi:hypothetical protein